MSVKQQILRGLFLSFPQAAMILFLALFDPLFSKKIYIYVAIETPVGSIKYSERKTKMSFLRKAALVFDQSSQMLLMCAASMT